MGGKLFNTNRIDRTEYDRVLELAKKAFNSIGVTVEEIPFYRNKDSFGDIDVITTSEQIDSIFYSEKYSWVETIIKALQEYSDSEVKVSSNSHSGYKCFLFNGVQLDLMYYPENTYKRNKDMLSWNDLFGFVGIMCRYFGVKLSSKKGVGISLNKYSGYNLEIQGQYNYYDIELESVLEWLGMDLEKYKIGFDTKEEIFKFLTDSPYYFNGLFSYENGNNKHRQRNKDRPIFKDMLEFCSKIDKGEKDTSIDKEKIVSKLSKIVGIDLLSEARMFGEIAYQREVSTRILRKIRINAMQEACIEKFGTEDFDKITHMFKSGHLNNSMSIEQVIRSIMLWKE